MEWTEEHDLQLLIEMRAGNVFSFKKGSPERGRIWEQITDTLNSEKTLKFCLKDKRGVRDRWNLLQGKFKRKRREEEGGSGLAVDEPSQKDVLIEELCELEDAALQSATVKNHDKKVAEDTRQKAMERLGETKKRKKEGDGIGELQVKKTGRSTSNAVGFLSEKMKVEQTEDEVEQNESGTNLPSRGASTQKKRTGNIKPGSATQPSVCFNRCRSKTGECRPCMSNPCNNNNSRTKCCWVCYRN